MGVSTDSYIAHGIDFGEDAVWPETLDPEGTGDPDLDSYIIQKALGIPYDYSAAHKVIIDAYPIDLVQHCHVDYPMWIVALRRSVVRASRGSPKSFVISEVTSEEIDAIKAFCVEFDLEYQEPRWLVFGNWS